MLRRCAVGVQSSVRALSILTRPSVLRTRPALQLNRRLPVAIQAAQYSGPVVRSPFKDVDIPAGNLSLTDFIFGESTPEDGDKEVLVDGVTGKSMTFSEVEESVHRFGSGLTRRGLRRGDIVSIFMPNSLEFGVAFLGTICAGGISSTVNTLYTANELEYQLKDAKVQMVITAAPLVPVAAEAARRCGLKEIIVEGLDVESEVDGVKLVPFSTIAADSGSVLPKFAVNNRTEVAALPYSSGTTGPPKGVQLSHLNLIANIKQIAADPELVSFRRRPDESILAVLPFFHIYAMVVLLLNGLHQRSRVITLPKFDPELFLSTVQKQKVTQLFVVPPIVIFLSKHPVVQKFDLSSVYSLFSGAAPLGGEIGQEASSKLGVRVVQVRS